MKNREMIFAISLLSAAAAEGIFYIYGAGIKGGIYALTAACLIIIAAEDAMTRQIHDVLLLAVAVLGAADYFAAFSDMPDRAAGALCVSLPMMLINLITLRSMEKNSFGSGDVILCFVCGFLFGIRSTLFACLTAFMCAGIYAAFLLIGRKASGQDVFAFGPFISMGFLLEMVRQGLF